jgi:hypothetical protein
LVDGKDSQPGPALPCRGFGEGRYRFVFDQPALFVLFGKEVWRAVRVLKKLPIPYDFAVNEQSESNPFYLVLRKTITFDQSKVFSNQFINRQLANIPIGVIYNEIIIVSYFQNVQKQTVVENHNLFS